MNVYTLDSAIFIGFLAITIIVGLASSRGTTTITQYAVGDRNFSTATLVATIVATWISGELFYRSITEGYHKGLYAMWIALGDPIYLLCVGLFFVPRMGEFLGNLSIAEAMGRLFGQKVRLVTAIASVAKMVGLIGIQLKLAGVIFEYALGISQLYGVIIATFIVTLYSALGGIKSVTFTDVIQFFTFAVVIPVVAYVLLASIENVDVIFHVVANNPLFDYKRVFDFTDPMALKQLFLFLLFITPGFNPTMFQRVAIAKDTKQAAKSYIIAAFTCLLFVIMMYWIALLALAIYPSLGPDEVMQYVISNASYMTGLKGAMLSGVMAMIMSTVDSCINSTAVITIHDLCKPLKIKIIKNEVLAAQVVSGLIGIASLSLSLQEGSLLELLVMVACFDIPTFSLPFIMAVFGFRSTARSVLWGMAAGAGTVLIGNYLLEIPMIHSLCFGLLANLIVLMSSHYLLKQPGGWVGIKDPAPLIAARHAREKWFRQLRSNLKSFNIIELCKKNCPQGEGLLSILGIFVMTSAFASAHTLAPEYKLQYASLMEILHPATLFTSSLMISYPLWLPSWKKTNMMCIFWNMVMFFILICFSFFMVLISHFSEIQLIVFMANILVLSSLVMWQWASFTITTGIIATIVCYHHAFHIEHQDPSLTLQFKIVYILLLIIGMLVAFLRPRQEHQARTEEQKHHLEVMMQDRDIELTKLQDLKHEFVRNLQHEVNTPLVGLMSLAPTLLDNFEQLTPEQIKHYLETVVGSSARYSSLAHNLLNLSNLSSMSYELHPTRVNVSQLIEDRLDYCRRLYRGNKPLEFVTNITPNLVMECDEHYITSAIDNLIINAIKYSHEGTITLQAHREGDWMIFHITDEGIGIPPSELYDVFGAFVVSSKTRTPAGGRGIGLALCQKIVHVHGGSIKAKSNGEKGATFIVELPLSKTDTDRS